MRFCALVSIVSLLLSVIAVNTLAATQVKNLRLWRAPDNTRLVFDLTGPLQYNVFTLTAPNRLVIDINGATLAGPLTISTANTPIVSIRMAQRTPTDLRVVIDLEKAVTPKSFVLAPNTQYGNRLVVDLYDQDTDTAPSLPVTNMATVPVTSVQPDIKLPPIRSGKRSVVVVIDAGHGGEDPGASGSGGQLEKDVVLAIAKELQRQIDGMRGFKAELTRTGDYLIPLRGRTKIARKKGADLFVSIHADAAPSNAAFGASVFALSERGATSETARWLADGENRSGLIGGAGNVSLDDKDQMLAGVLLDLSMTASLTSSLSVGQKILGNIGQVTPLHKQRVEEAGFIVLKSPDIPSVLVETGFISNTNEANKLASTSHQQALARSISSGVRQFFQQNPPPGSYIAWLRDTGTISHGACKHRVRPGETLGMIAMRYQVDVTILRSSNDLKNDELKIGENLDIPATKLASKQ